VTLGFVEAVTRHVARGWAFAPDRRVVVRALCEGAVLGEAVADLHRGDVAAAGVGDGNCGFVLDLSAHAAGLGGKPVALVDAATGVALQGSPAVAADPAGLGRFLARWDGVAAPVLARLARMMRHRLRGAGVSVLAPRGAMAGVEHSLRAQLAGRWEILEAGAAGLAAARYPLVLVVRRALRLERDALWHLLRAAAATKAAAVTWDGIEGGEALCRGAFSIDGFRSLPDPGAAFALRRAAARAGGWADAAEMVLRAAEAGAVAHVPRLLHRAPAPPRPPGRAALAAVRRHLARVAPRARASLGDGMVAVEWPAAAGRTLAVIPTRNQGRLLRACLESLMRTRGDVPLDIVVIDHESDEPETRDYLRAIRGLVTVMPHAGPFDFARMNNAAVARYGGEAETLLFLNNDTEALEPGWLARMRSLAVRPEVGAVGALLLYGDRRVQHAGVVLGFDGSATHAHAQANALTPEGRRVPGYLGELVSLREVSAVTAACMMVRREVFARAGGFDLALPVGFNDTDLCLRLRALGYRNLQDGQSVLLHHESRSRKPAGLWLHAGDTAVFQARYAAAIAAGDPFTSPNFRRDVQTHELRWDCLPGGSPMVTSGASAGPAPRAGRGAAARSP